ncbi:Uncharacterised protein [uncultured archaeon]|nr:Uncharacterised protein [uncultured archaeon]
MEAKKLALYIILFTSIITLLFQTPVIQAVGRGQHTFISGRNVDCVACHRFDAFMDMNSSEKIVFDAHKRAAGNKNYTTYLQVGGISYDPSGFIYTNVDSVKKGANDTWVWNGSMWIYNNTARLYDLDLNGNGDIDGSEICKLCHNLELMGVSTPVSEVHTVGTRYCDDDRCHGNKNNILNDYRLFAGSSNNLTASGMIISNNKIHGPFYNGAASMDSNKSILHSYGITPGNAASSNSNNVSGSPFTCLGCHSFINVTGSVAPAPRYNHSNPKPLKGRYT